MINTNLIKDLMLTLLHQQKMDMLRKHYSNANIKANKSGYDNWDGGTDIYDIEVQFIAEDFYSNRTAIESSIEHLKDVVNSVFSSIQGAWVGEIRLIPVVKSEQKIKCEYRQQLFDAIELNDWYVFGKSMPADFLSRIFNLRALESHDSRFTNAEGDIQKHTEFNDDWEKYWIFSDPRFNLTNCQDSDFLKFLSEVLNPKHKNTHVDKLVDVFNKYLNPCGIEFYESDRIGEYGYYRWRESIGPFSTTRRFVEEAIQEFDNAYIHRQIKRIENSIDSDPDLAIGTSKELIEACCKTILDLSSVEFEKSLELPKLVKETCKVLKLTPDDIPNDAKAADTIKRILSNFSSIAQGIAELRNIYGTGHGKIGKKGGPTSRHAKLAAGAASTMVIFLFETFKQRAITE